MPDRERSEARRGLIKDWLMGSMRQNSVVTVTT